MKKSRYSEEQVAYALRLAEGGTPVADVCRQIGIEGLWVFQTILRVSLRHNPAHTGQEACREETVLSRADHCRVAAGGAGRASRRFVPQDRNLRAELLSLEEGLRQLAAQ